MDKRKAAAAATAAVAAASVVTSAAFDSPVELIEPTPIVETLAPDTASEEDGVLQEDEERQQGPRSRFRAWAMGLPAGVRALVGIPLWIFGRMIMLAGSLLWTGASVPLLRHVLGWVCLALLALAVLGASVKAAFPKVPLRRIFRLRRVAWLLGVTAVLAAADLALPTVWEMGTILRPLWRFGEILLLVCLCSWSVRREGEEEAARAALEAEKTEEPLSVEETAMRLADTVCPPRFS